MSRRTQRRSAARTIQRVRQALRRGDCTRAYDLFRYANIGLAFESVSPATRQRLRQQVRACAVGGR